MKYFEEYKCGCVSPNSSKKDLLGYCDKHGADRINIYRADGGLYREKPAPEEKK